MKKVVDGSKQSTLDDLSFQFNIQKPDVINKSNKEIVINNISNTIREDELALNVEFTLLPSKLAFSKVNLDLFFEDHLLNSTALVIPQSSLLNSNFNFPLVLEMRGMSAAKYIIRVEMYEPWSNNEKLSFTLKEIILEYIPKTRESRLVKIPLIKSIARANLAIASPSEKSIYLDIEQDLRRESQSKRDNW